MTLSVYGQISPGKLSEAHAHLEGISNCTQCHDLGNQVPDQKCLACHEEVDRLINLNRGYHASNEVKAKNCVSCHNDHHGRKFDLIRFDEDAFDHQLAGYPLEGAHSKIDCRECHQPEYIQDTDLRKRSETFLGLETDCLSCHDDFHQGTLSNNCISCHDMDAFRPASRFDHDETAFALTGAHQQVDCLACHPSETRNGESFQVFSGIEFNRCTACHNDAHQGQLPGACTSCHSTERFDVFTGQNRFQHDLTSFELKGQHATINCFDCHDNSKNASTIFQDNNGIQENECIACHEDVHEGKFGTDCASCHHEESFLTLLNTNVFNHDLTDYPLIGQHIGVDCKECHQDRYTEPIPFEQCKNCHEDYHEGVFTREEPSKDCQECHLVTESFTYTTFGFEDHENTDFPLTGAHMATPCFACHISEDEWAFENLPKKCVDCHSNVHEEHISGTYFPEEDCTVCHITDSWSAVAFDHSLTEWPLEGQHKEVDCKSCHYQDESIGITSQVFKSLSTDCIHCHENIHGDQFEVGGSTDCKRCHSFNGWGSGDFNHDRTRFPLDGRHAEIECTACHKPELQANGEEIIQYKIEKFECIDCHS